MKTLELSDETHAALQGLAARRNLTVDQLLASLLQEARSPLDAGDLRSFLAGPFFLSLADSTERYLALLAWCATNHAADFADFISHQESGHRYLMLSREEVQEIRAHNHSRQIDGTQYWAVMTIDPKSKRRFVRRLLEFIGCPDEAVTEACRALGLDAGSEPARHLGVA
jgi:negative regulator of replication initiation